MMAGEQQMRTHTTARRMNVVRTVVPAPMFQASHKCSAAYVQISCHEFYPNRSVRVDRNLWPPPKYVELVSAELHCVEIFCSHPHQHRARNGILPSCGLLRGVRWFETDVSRLPVCPIFKGQGASSVSNDVTPRNNPEDGRFQFVCAGGLRSGGLVMLNTGVSGGQVILNTGLSGGQVIRNTGVSGGQVIRNTGVSGGQVILNTGVSGGQVIRNTGVSGGQVIRNTGVSGGQVILNTGVSGGQVIRNTGVSGGQVTLNTEVSGGQVTLNTEVSGGQVILKTGVK